ncbi:hypothetical protein WOLCODRAFT_145160 [Wolfiporia cocos MD-104 SS10]|uniref:E3 ubiquitin-protein ligase listerin n=1 Tax=Wolfiporia cocos (strain MD-104) TaxID=742152 RepID=A0A2H3K6S9_WOLCO|nr:hypothetical protein WOLCODRAFT_145160 [Wolfiporia cocos MD-104 SS10]
MAKGKSSASSATRKKHARKAAAVHGEPAADPAVPKEKKAKGKDKRSKNEPRKKVYIPPVKPAPVRLDPLDTLGLAQTLPPELTVVLRRLAKKDGVTKRRALEELVTWIDRAGAEGENETQEVLAEMVPVWLHHLPFLLLHPTRGIRQLATSLHSSLLTIPHTSARLLSYILSELEYDQQDCILGTWLLATYDVDRQTAARARETWAAHTAFLVPNNTNASSTGSIPRADKLTLDRATLTRLWSFLLRALRDPGGLYAALNPTQPSTQPVELPSSRSQPRKGSPQQKKGAAPTPPRKGPLARMAEEDARRSPSPGAEGGVSPRAEDEEESEGDRRARLRVGACGAVGWVLGALAEHGSVGGEGEAEKEKEKEKEDALDAALAPLADPLLWTILHPAQHPPFSPSADGFGHDQPGVRSAAWSLLHALLKTCKAVGRIGADARLLMTLSRVVLRSAWVELDVGVRGVLWVPVLIFLRDFPQCWEIEAAPDASRGDAGDAESDEEDEDDEDEGDEEEDRQQSQAAEARGEQGRPVRSTAWREFMDFLALGCSGAPVQGYPAVLVVLSTVPDSILFTPGDQSSSSSIPCEELLVNFWAALDGRALSGLDRKATNKAFLEALCECVVLIVRRLMRPTTDSTRKPGTTSEGDSRTLVSAQVQRIWDELCAKRIRLSGALAGACLARLVEGMWRADARLFDAAWTPLAAGVRAVSAAPAQAPAKMEVGLFIDVVKTLRQHFDASAAGQEHSGGSQGTEGDVKGRTPREAVRELVDEVAEEAIARCESVLAGTRGDEVQGEVVSSVVKVLEGFPDAVFSKAELVQRLDSGLLSNTPRLLALSSDLLVTYLKYNSGNEASCNTLWQRVLDALSEHPEHLQPLLSAAHELPEYLKPQADEGDLSGLVNGFVESMLIGEGKENIETLKLLLLEPDHFLHKGRAESIVGTLATAVTDRLHMTMRDASVDLSVFDGPLSIFRGYIERGIPRSASSQGRENVNNFAEQLMPEIFLYAHLLPLCRAVEHFRLTMAQSLWSAWQHGAPEEVRARAMHAVSRRIREVLADCESIATPDQIVRMLTESYTGDILKDVFPTAQEMASMLETLPSCPADASIAVLDPLVPLCSPGDEQLLSPDHGPYSSDGFSSYARISYGLLLYLLNDRHTAKTNAWTLRHFLALSLYAEELLVLGTSSNPVFTTSVARSILEDVKSKVNRLSAYLLSSVQPGWHAAVVSTIMADRPDPGLDSVGRLVAELVRQAQRIDTVRESRILYSILQHALDEATTAEAEQWILLARKTERTARQMSLAILYAVTQYAPEPPILDRYRNELAAGMMGVPASKANAEGLWLLRRLAASAPDPESDVIFLPQQRAVNVLKACQQWITADEDLEEEVDSAMTLVFLPLAPILQNVPGGHWDLMFDVLENNLEDVSLTEPDTLVTLSRTLRLFMATEDLASTNKALREMWQQRRLTCLTLIRDLVTAKPEPSQISKPLSVCRELALQALQDIPDTLLNHSMLSKEREQLCHLVMDTSVEVQKSAYSILREVARKYTEHMVIEAAVDTEVATRIELPVELIKILVRSPDPSLDPESEPLTGYCLAWMLTFDLFSDASFGVKSQFISQLRDLALVGTHLLPCLFSILGLYAGSTPFKLGIWEIDQYDLDLYTADSLCLSLLSAHIYYRALLTVPTLVRSWLSDCRDRQLALSVSSYTARNFSPALIHAELVHVRDPEATTEAADEAFNVRVASAVNEATASYSVDERQLEVTVRFPVDYPLHGIEIRNSTRIGVPEEKWRAWILGLQQILSYRSGSIVDGFGFFKRNIISLFEGLTECAICYSIVSATDGSLPRKPCKTCKNRFHAGCLYTWFSTSHSSNCPLCRSEIMLEAGQRRRFAIDRETRET